jgi:ATP-dependent helicase HrpB
LDEESIIRILAGAFSGLTLAKEAQAVPLLEAFHAYVGSERLSWIDELAPKAVRWPGGRELKILYVDQMLRPGSSPQPPELQIKLHECFVLQEHPRVCEGHVPVKLWLCNPEGKRLESTCDWPAFKMTNYPKLKPALKAKFPGIIWP